MYINHLSISRVSVWLLCQQQYKYKYQDKLQMIGEEPIYFAYGSIVHKIAEKYIELKGKVQIKEIANDVLAGKIPIENKGNKGNPKPIPKLPQEYKNKLVDHLKAIKKVSDQIGFDGFTEWQFDYDLEPPNQKMVTGFIDRLVQRDDKFWILDYKTTKPGWFRKTKKDIAKDLQLRAYARIVQKTFDAKAENIKAGLYYLEGAELVGVCFTEASLDAVEKELLMYYNQIESADPNAVWGTVGQHCSKCDYRKICPFYSLT